MVAQRPPTFLTGPETAGPGVRLAQVLDLAEPAVPADLIEPESPALPVEALADRSTAVFVPADLPEDRAPGVSILRGEAAVVPDQGPLDPAALRRIASGEAEAASRIRAALVA